MFNALLNFPVAAIQEFVEDDKTMTGILVGIALSLTLMSCVLWPFEGMHFVLQKITNFLPIHAPIDSIYSILIRDLEFCNPKVLSGFKTLATWIIALGSHTTYLKILNN